MIANFVRHIEFVSNRTVADNWNDEFVTRREAAERQVQRIRLEERRERRAVRLNALRSAARFDIRLTHPATPHASR